MNLIHHQVPLKHITSKPHGYFRQLENLLHHLQFFLRNMLHWSLMMMMNFLLQGMMHFSIMFMLLRHKLIIFHVILQLIHVNILSTYWQNSFVLLMIQNLTLRFHNLIGYFHKNKTAKKPLVPYIVNLPRKNRMLRKTNFSP